MKVVGMITPDVAAKVGLKLTGEVLVYLGESNIAHMKNKHPGEYAAYGQDISNIINHPDYVGRNTKDDSIEFVKEYVMNNEYVKVAVRVSVNGNYYARSLYRLNSNRVKNFIANGKLQKVY